MLDQIDWKKIDGLLPVIIQDANTMVVLMLGYMNREALQKSLEEGVVTFFSRTRQCLWTKGKNSGHYLRIKQHNLDCDNDALLIQVEATSPVCHRNTTSCFENKGNT